LTTKRADTNRPFFLVNRFLSLGFDRSWHCKKLLFKP